VLGAGRPGASGGEGGLGGGGGGGNFSAGGQGCVILYW
jgi:hypothetical protein